MTTSGTTSFAPSLGELVLYAYNLAGIRNTAIIQEHMSAARMAANLALADWANRGVNLWRVELVTTPLVAGTESYSVDPSIVFMLDAYISMGTGEATNDRLILPVSRSEYASYPNKLQEGLVTTFWFNRLLAPNVNLYYVPDGTQPYLKYYAMQQMQDANFTSGQTVDIPYLWLTAFAYSLAAELAVIWAPDRVQLLQGRADRAYAAAADANIETAQQYILPQVGGYFRP